MYHNEINQLNQSLNQMNQMAEQMRQMEASNQQMLNQLAQREASAVHQIQTMQQMLQQCSRMVQNLQSQAQGSLATHGHMGSTYSTANINLGPTQNYAQGIMRTSAPLVDPATMDPTTYQNSLQRFNNRLS